MPSKRKKTKKKPKTSNIVATKRAKKALRKKQPRPPKQAVKKKQSSKMTSSKGSSSAQTKTHVRRGPLETVGREDAVAARPSPDSEGLSQVERADSESVDELVEEGNIFEAGVVAGVEEADDQDTGEVHTHEVPEDDVPDEYLDKD